jgi:hypothetical protein
MFNSIKVYLAKLNQQLSSVLNEASSTCSALNAHHYVDVCHPIDVEIPQWHSESAGELATLVSQPRNS